MNVYRNIRVKSKSEVKEINIKNSTCYYFEDIVTDRDIYSIDVLLYEKIYENISVYDIPYKTSTRPKPLRLIFNKIDGFIRVRGSE